MARRRTRWARVIPTVTLTAMPFTVFGPTAQAFFPPLPATPTNNPVTVVTPPDTPPITTTVPPTPPPPFVPPPPPPPVIVEPPPPPPPVVVPCEPCHHSCTIPEPSTIVAGFTGLVAAAGWAARRRKKGV